MITLFSMLTLSGCDKKSEEDIITVTGDTIDELFPMQEDADEAEDTAGRTMRTVTSLFRSICRRGIILMLSKVISIHGMSGICLCATMSRKTPKNCPFGLVRV